MPLLPLASSEMRTMTAERSPQGPMFVPPYQPKTGGVDFLGLRQVNLEMAARLIPGINNVTYFLRPFSVLSWTYWKFHHLSEASQTDRPTAQQLRIWKEKVETLFTWGHKLNKISGLPGLDSAPPGRGRVPLDFESWHRTALNTSLMAAV